MNDRAAVKIKGKYGFINREGALCIPAIYEDIGFFSDEYVNVMKGGKWGYIDKDGKVVTKFKYDNATVIRDGHAEITLKGRKGYLEIVDGKPVESFENRGN